MDGGADGRWCSFVEVCWPVRGWCVHGDGGEGTMHDAGYSSVSCFVAAVLGGC